MKDSRDVKSIDEAGSAVATRHDSSSWSACSLYCTTSPVA